MRLFDVVGGAIVVSWFALVTSFAYKVNVRDVAPEVKASDTVVITPGSSWMILSRDTKDIGYVHEVRTRLDEGWLFEYELMMAISIAGQDRLIDTGIKATLDDDARLRSFQGSVDSLLGTFALKGDVELEGEGAVVNLLVDLGGEPSERTIALPQAPRLSSNALNQLIAQPDLVPGMVYEQEFFDPMSMGNSKLVYEYVERKEVDVYEQKVEALHFRQKVMGNELDVFVTPQGEIVIQEFPMRTLGVRVPAVIAKSRVGTLRKDLKEGERKVRTLGGGSVPSEVGGVAGILERANSGESTGVSGALQLLGDVLDVGTDADAASYWRVEGFSDEIPTDIESPRQRVLERGVSARSLTIALGVKGSEGLRPWTPPALTPEQRAALLAVAPLEDDAPGQDTPEDEDAPGDDGKDAPPAEEEASPTEVLAAAREAGGGALSNDAAVAALRRAGVPARHASGAAQAGDSGEVSRLYGWIQFYDGGAFVDVDPRSPDFALGENVIQLRVGASAQQASAAEALKTINIRRINTARAEGAPEEGGDDAPGE